MLQHMKQIAGANACKCLRLFAPALLNDLVVRLAIPAIKSSAYAKTHTSTILFSGYAAKKGTRDEATRPAMKHDRESPQTPPKPWNRLWLPERTNDADDAGSSNEGPKTRGGPINELIGVKAFFSKRPPRAMLKHVQISPSRHLVPHAF